MKKVFALILIIALVTSLLGGIPVFAAKEYVVNGDMSYSLGALGEMATLPTSWNKKTGVSAIKDSDGECCVQIISTGDTYMSSPWYNLQPGDRVTLEFDLKIVSLTANGGSACISVAFGKKNSAGELKTVENKLNFNFYEHRGEWAHYKYDFLIPDNCQGISFLFRLLNGGEIYYDNISLTNTLNETTLRVASGDLELDRIPDGVNSVKAKLHYVPESSANESGNLIFAAYSKNELVALEITPFSVSSSNSTYQEVTLELPDGAEDISVKAYVWKNGQTTKPIAESELLPKKGRSAAFDRLVTERMRAVYDASTLFYGHDQKGNPNGGGPELMQKFIDSGINTFIFLGHYDKNGTGVDKNNDALRNLLTDLSNFVDETGCMMFLKLNYGTNAPATMKNYGLYECGKPHSKVVVCPLAEGYWKDAMERRMKIVAEFPNITGVILDFEMYNGTGTKYNDPCYCDTCVAKFAELYPSEAANALVTTEVNSRQEFSKVNSLFNDYQIWQDKEIERISKSIREATHAINPNLIIGIMPCYNWLGGIEEGLGTEEMPVMVFDESSFSGNVQGNIKINATMKNEGLHTVQSSALIPAENGERIPVANFAAKVAEAGTINMGYWIYTMSHLQDNEDYYPELKKGNEMLDEKLGLK